MPEQEKTKMKIQCPSCSSKLDVTDLKPFTVFSCPQCGSEVTVPMRFQAYILEEDHIINIDLGCAAMGRRDGYDDEKALCCMNLSAYGRGAGTEAFTYYRNN